jgi:hypothetical protein
MTDASCACSNALALYPRLASSRFWYQLEGRQPSVAMSSIRSALVLTRYQIGIDDLRSQEVLARLLEYIGERGESECIARLLNAQLTSVSGMW